MGAKGGESIHHKKLRVFVLENPDCVSVEGKIVISETEKSLPSGDRLDVFFETRKRWYGIEVKSHISSESDIIPGLYQCVKYKVVMEKHLAVLGIDMDVKVILALGHEFPRDLIPIKNTLGVNYVDTIEI